jgi:hypothetical protein
MEHVVGDLAVDRRIASDHVRKAPGTHRVSAMRRPPTRARKQAERTHRPARISKTGNAHIRRALFTDMTTRQWVARPTAPPRPPEHPRLMLRGYQTR